MAEGDVHVVDTLLKELLERPALQAELRRALGVHDDIQRALERLSSAQERTEAEVKALSSVVGSLSTVVRDLGAAQARTEDALQELSGEVKALAAAQRRTDQTVGALADNVGFGLEELAVIVVPDVLSRTENVHGLSFERRYFAAGLDAEEELDLYAEGTREGTKVTVIGEVKSRIYPREVERFGARVTRLKPRLEGDVLPVMFGFVVHPTATLVAERLGIRLVASRPGRAA